MRAAKPGVDLHGAVYKTPSMPKQGLDLIWE
jgi:hypothetical protein